MVEFKRLLLLLFWLVGWLWGEGVQLNDVTTQRRGFAGFTSNHNHAH